LKAFIAHIDRTWDGAGFDSEQLNIRLLHCFYVGFRVKIGDVNNESMVHHSEPSSRRLKASFACNNFDTSFFQTRKASKRITWPGVGGFLFKTLMIALVLCIAVTLFSIGLQGATN